MKIDFVIPYKYYANEKHYNKTFYNILYFYSFCTDFQNKNTVLAYIKQTD